MATTTRALLSLSLILLVLSPCILAVQSGLLSGRIAQQPQRLGRGQQALNDCDITRLSANEPNIRHESEGGRIEIWEPNDQQFRCAGVTVVRHVVESKGLVLPAYANAPHISYIVQGKGMMGVNIPGCPETYESGRSSSQQEEFTRGGRGAGSESERIRGDQHQKVRRLRQGDIVALPAGVSKWVYNDGESPLTCISLYDTNNFQNQLDQNLKTFFLAGNPQEFGQEQGRHQTGRHERGSRGQQEQQGGNNILSGFDQQLLAEAFGVDPDTINKIQGRDDNRGSIIRVEEDLQILLPEEDEEERETVWREEHRHGRRERGTTEEEQERRHRGGRRPSWEEEEERRHRGERGTQERRHRREGQTTRREEEEERRHGGGGRRPGGDEPWEERHRGGQQGESTRWEEERRHHSRGGRSQCERRYAECRSRSFEVNGLEETFCSAKLKENIDIPRKADVFNPHGGRLTSLNSDKLPILSYLQLSAERVRLYQNAIMAPHWRINAHSICYFTKGTGRIQVVNHQGQLVFDDTVQEGQLLVVPQNFAVVQRAGRDGLEWVTFMTNDEAMISPLAGRISAIRGMPEEVVMNSYGVSREDAKRLKYSREEFTVFSPSIRSQRRDEEFAIV